MKKDEWVRKYALDTARRDNIPLAAYQHHREWYEKEALEHWEMMHPPRKKNFLDRMLGWWID